MRLITLGIALALSATNAAAQTPVDTRVDLSQVTQGHAYYVRPGAVLEQHNAALLQCIADTASPQIRDPAIGAGGALVIGLVWGGTFAGIAAAATENCMVVRGWSIYRLSADEGRFVESLSPVALAAYMSPLVGADAPRGEFVRSFDNLAARPDAYLTVESPRRPGPEHLSLRLVKDLPLPPSGSLAPLDTGNLGRPLRDGRVIAAPPSGFGTLLLRVRNNRRRGSGVFFDLPPTSTGAGRRPVGGLRIFFREVAGPEGRWLAINVPAARWSLAGAGSLNFCLGEPTFEVASGEIVYVGTLDLAGSDIGPDMDMAPVRAWLDPAVVDLARPAEYRNGGTRSCNNEPGHINALEISGAPFDPLYRGGSVEPPPLPDVATKPDFGEAGSRSLTPPRPTPPAPPG